MLLAAGRGQRMEPLSSLVAKPALEVLGRPLLASAMEHLLAAGCDPIVVNLHRHPQQVAAAVRSVALHGGVRFSWEKELLGSAGGIAAARPYFLAGPVLVANADVWGALDLSPLLKLARPDRAVLGVLPHPDPRRWSAVELEEGGAVRRIVRPGESLRGVPHLFTGFQLLGEEVLSQLPSPPADMAPIWEMWMGRRVLFGAPLRGHWREAGTPEAYRQLVVGLVGELGWQHPTAQVAGDAEIRRSAVGAGCTLGAGAVVTESVLTAGARVGAGVRLSRCVVAGEVEVSPGVHLADRLVLPGASLPLV